MYNVISICYKVSEYCTTLPNYIAVAKFDHGIATHESGVLASCNGNGDSFQVFTAI